MKFEEKSERYYDKKVTDPKFKLGEFVFLLKEPRKGKFERNYSGPFEILEISDRHNDVKLKINKNKTKTVYVDKIKYHVSALDVNDSIHVAPLIRNPGLYSEPLGMMRTNDSIHVAPLIRNPGLYPEPLKMMRTYYTTWTMVAYNNTDGLITRRKQLEENSNYSTQYCQLIKSNCLITGQLETMEFKIKFDSQFKSYSARTDSL